MSRKSHQPDPVAARNPVALRHRDTAVAQVAILGLPAVAMVDQHAVAALLAVEQIRRRAGEPEVGHAVAQRPDFAVGRRQHRHARPHRGEGIDREIGALVAVIGLGPAGEILGPRPGIAVEVVHHEAVVAEGAVDRQAELGLGLQGGGQEPDEECRGAKNVFHGVKIGPGGPAASRPLPGRRFTARAVKPRAASPGLRRRDPSRRARRRLPFILAKILRGSKGAAPPCARTGTLRRPRHDKGPTRRPAPSIPSSRPLSPRSTAAASSSMTAAGSWALPPAGRSGRPSRPP